MRCCDRPCWFIWHPSKERNVAWACRLCGKLTPMPGFEECEAWSQNEWRKNRRVLGGKNDGRKPVCNSPLRRQNPVALRTKVVDGTKDCTLCKERLPLSAFSIDRRETTSGATKYKAWCKPCMVAKDRERHARKKAERDAR